MGKRSRWGFGLVLMGALALPVIGAKAATAPPPPAAPTPCNAPAPAGQLPPVTTGVVVCQEFDSFTLGNPTGTGVPAPFEYFVPPACSQGHPCPVLYLLHGFGGDYTEMLGQPGTTGSAWVQAETKAPPPGFESAPWNYYDPTTWKAVDPAQVHPFILVAPLGQTLPNGYGPAAGMDSYWINWNPRYARGGDSQRYDTPAPQFETYVTQELPAFVESFLPAVTGRAGRAIAGVSLGGYGSFKLGLQHPDLYSSMISVSGAHNFLFAPAPVATPAFVPAPANSPIPIPYTALPAPTREVTSEPLPSQVGTFITALDAFGDPVADQAYFRGNMPTDLAANGHTANGPSIGIDFFVNNMVPARSQDASSEPFEMIVFPMNMDMEADLTAAGVDNTFAIHQGNHSDVYRNAWFNGLETYAWDHLSGAPPTSFDYRSISTNFDIWGWHFQSNRVPTEFLDLTNVSCDGLTMSGSGAWAVTPPKTCAHHKTFTVDLGASAPADQPVSVVGESQTKTISNH